MGLESASYISELVATNPVGAVDDYATADDHLRLIKAVLQGQFPNFTAAAANPSIAELNFLVGVTSAIQAQFTAAADASNLSAGVLADGRVQASNVTQHVASIDHNSLLNYLVQDHVAWGVAGGGTIHRDHLPSASTGAEGITEYALDAEAIVGTSDAHALTPGNLGNVWFSGAINTGGTAIRLPAGWSVSKPGTGRYKVTHNLGLGVPNADLIVVGNIWGVTSTIDVVIISINTNDFELQTRNASVLSDAPSAFVAHRAV